MMTISAEQAIELLQQTGKLVTRLQSTPTLIPLVRDILDPVMNGNGHGNGLPAPAKVKRRQVRNVLLKKKKRTISAAQRRQLSMAAKARWAKAKKAGKSTIGTAD